MDRLELELGTLGELLEWLGFSLAAWSLAGLAFAAYTAAIKAATAVRATVTARVRATHYQPKRPHGPVV